MARYTGADCRRCRREKMKLFLKGSKCDGPNCPFESRPFLLESTVAVVPKKTEHLLQLREKQKVRRVYGVLEKQFRRLLRGAVAKQAKTGEVLLLHPRVAADNADLPRRLRQIPEYGPPAGQARPLRGERQARSTSRCSASTSTTSSGFGRSRRAHAVPGRAGRGRFEDRSGVA